MTILQNTHGDAASVEAGWSFRETEPRSKPSDAQSVLSVGSISKARELCARHCVTISLDHVLNCMS